MGEVIEKIITNIFTDFFFEKEKQFRLTQSKNLNQI